MKNEYVAIILALMLFMLVVSLKTSSHDYMKVTDCNSCSEYTLNQTVRIDTVDYYPPSPFDDHITFREDFSQVCVLRLGYEYCREFTNKSEMLDYAIMEWIRK